MYEISNKQEYICYCILSPYYIVPFIINVLFNLFPIEIMFSNHYTHIIIIIHVHAIASGQNK